MKDFLKYSKTLSRKYKKGITICYENRYIILSNPADKVDLPKIEEYKPKFYTSDEVKTLLNEVLGTKLEIL